MNSEVERIARVSEMMVTAHASEDERLGRLSFFAEAGLLVCNVSLIAIAFADSTILMRFLGKDSLLWIGVFSVIVFIFSFVANYMDWKVRAIKHKAAFQTFLDFKFTATHLISQPNPQEEKDFIARYNLVTPTLILISEEEFVHHKQRHKLKVFISKYLDKHPAANILLLRLRLWYFQNIPTIFEEPRVGQQ